MDKLNESHTGNRAGKAKKNIKSSGDGRGPGAIAPTTATADVYAESPARRGDMTALEQHVAFFDRNHDGTIELRETYEGLRAIGIGRVLSAWFAVVINGALGLPTSGSFKPTLSIKVDNIHKAKHASDTDVYDKDGRFDPDRFDALFARWDKDRDGALNLRELIERTWGDHDLFDLFGLVASAGEWGLLYALAGKGGKLTREQVRQMFDGSLFYELERERASRGAAQAHS